LSGADFLGWDRGGDDSTDPPVLISWEAHELPSASL
jgi:hypothetical protein